MVSIQKDKDINKWVELRECGFPYVKYLENVFYGEKCKIEVKE
jgi:hypothetical protein